MWILGCPNLRFQRQLLEVELIRAEWLVMSCRLMMWQVDPAHRGYICCFLSSDLPVAKSLTYSPFAKNSIDKLLFWHSLEKSKRFLFNSSKRKILDKNIGLCVVRSKKEPICLIGKPKLSTTTSSSGPP